MAARSAGIVLVRAVGGIVEVLLVHPGGPFWAKKDAGAWSIPKGEHEPNEDPLTAAVREFREELGVDCPDDALLDLGEIVQAGGKRVRGWGGLGSIDAGSIVSNTFDMVWPPRSGRVQQFPEIDRAEYFPVEIAVDKILAGQRPFVDRAVRALMHAGRLASPG